MFLWSLLGRASYRRVAIRFAEFLSGKPWEAGTPEWRAYGEGLLKIAPLLYGLILILWVFT